MNPLIQRQEPDAETLRAEAETQINKEKGILVLDDSTLDKPFSKRNALASRHCSGKHKTVVYGINLITVLWTYGELTQPCDYRIFDKETDRKTKNTILQKCFSKHIVMDLSQNRFVSIVGNGRLKTRNSVVLWAGIFRRVEIESESKSG